MAAILDSSLTLAWVLEDEEVPLGPDAVEQLFDGELSAPAVWPFEVANGIWQAIRRGRIRFESLPMLAEALENLAVTVEISTLDLAMTLALPLARERSLTAYDATYLELALRRGVPLATLDAPLRAAATRAGVELIP